MTPIGLRCISVGSLLRKEQISRFNLAKGCVLATCALATKQRTHVMADEPIKLDEGVTIQSGPTNSRRETSMRAGPDVGVIGFEDGI